MKEIRGDIKQLISLVHDNKTHIAKIEEKQNYFEVRLNNVEHALSVKNNTKK